MPELFLAYCDEHFETHKGHGFYSAEQQLDPTILTETVLAAKNVVKREDEKIDKVLEAVEASGAAMEQKLRSRLGEIQSLSRKMEQLETAVKARGARPYEKNHRFSAGARHHLQGPPVPS